MVETTVYSTEGEQVGTIELDPSVFGVEVNTAVMHQALKRQLANARQGTAATKTRGEVAGGAVKPWRQKGTGRARQGTIRSPLWKGGGIVFGPHPRSYQQKLPRKARRLAITSALTTKVEDNQLIIVDDLNLAQPRTKDMIALLDRIGAGPSTLIVLAERNDNIELSARNLAGVKTTLAANLSVADILNYDYLVMTRAALQAVSERYGG